MIQTGAKLCYRDIMREVFANMMEELCGRIEGENKSVKHTSNEAYMKGKRYKSNEKQYYLNVEKSAIIVML